MTLRLWSGFLILVLCLSCASARVLNGKADKLFKKQNFIKAAVELENTYQEEGVGSADELLFLLEIGLSYHAAGQYQKSNEYLLKADRLAEIKDYTSLVTSSATFLTSENIKYYLGEDFEKVLINTYLAMNYALLGNFEDALVEARRVNRKLLLMKTEGKRDYKQNLFARYLCAVLYEADKEWEDAYIDYKKSMDLVSGWGRLEMDLWRGSYHLNRRQDQKLWKKKFKIKPDLILNYTKSSKKSELIILFENGQSPEKRPHPGFYSIPLYYKRYNPVRYANVFIDQIKTTQTKMLFNIEKTAIKNLKDQAAAIIAKKMAGVVAKEAVSYGIEESTDSPVLGFLSRLFFYASDQADLRSWKFLPRDLQMARIWVDAGRHEVVLRANRGDWYEKKQVYVPEGKKVFVNFRYIP